MRRGLRRTCEDGDTDLGHWGDSKGTGRRKIVKKRPRDQ
jgi:hypothetical protein